MNLVLIRRYVGRCCGLAKSLNRDVFILIGIYKNKMEIINTLKRFNMTTTDFTNDTVVKAACSLFLAQIGENLKLLSDSSTEYMNRYVDVRDLRRVRNEIDHVYHKVDNQDLRLKVSSVISKVAIQAVLNRIEYCKKNCKSK